MTAPIQRALAFLRADVLRNVVLLKMLALFPNVVECHYYKDGSGAGVLILLPTTVSSFARHTYPTTDYVVLLSATSQSNQKPDRQKEPIGDAGSSTSARRPIRPAAAAPPH